MPHIDYPSVIHESAEDLLALEHWLRGQRTEARVRMLRLLKSGHAPPSPRSATSFAAREAAT